MKVLIFCLALCTLTHAIYMNRMAPINRMTSVNRLRSPTVFRPGVSMQGLQSFQGLHGFNMQSMQRPWNFGTMRLAPAASQRAPYFLYRSQPQRYAMKHYAPATRNMFTHSWKTAARLPLMAPATEFEFLKAASAQAEAHNDGGTGAIHTIPAPNLSLSEKPIVVLDASEMPDSEQAKPTYEVTEKYPEEYNVAKIEPPIGFTKANSFSTPELQNLIRNGATLQLAPEYSMPAANRPHPLMPQQFQMVQSINSLPSHQDFLNTGAEGIFIAPNALFQSDPMYLQKIQTQLLQRFPAVEFIPYDADVQNHINFQPQQQQASEHNPHIVLLQNEQIDRPLQLQITEQIGNKNIVQRETQEASVVTIVPKAFVAPNTTEKQIEVNSSQQPQNLTVELVAIEPVSSSSTVKYIVETSTEEGKTTPIYYAQVGQSVGNVIANGFYSAINDVRAAATVAQMEKGTVAQMEKGTVAQMEKAPETVPEKPIEHTTSTTTLVPDVKAYFVPSEDKHGNETTAELKPLLGAPFKKATESVNIAYTLVRADDKQPKLTQEGTVYAGQIVEATISEDQDFNKEKANLVSRRAPIRLFAVKDSNNIAGATKSTPTPEVVKAKLPAKSKLTFDHKTGEPIIRIYASYSDSTAQKDAVLTKLATLKPAKDSVIKRDLMESWKGTTVKTADKSQGFDANQVTQFGLKLKHRSDDYIPLFQEYED